jgi:2-amino-4-hydroxy-6-hydroxymethyldihydropteridine diphosphokinase
MTTYNHIILALGSNAPGAWGTSEETLQHAVKLISSTTTQLIAISAVYKSKAVGPGMQRQYLNAVVIVAASLPVGILLRRFKAMERSSGRKSGAGQRWGPRTLDIDIIDHRGRVFGRPVKSRGSRPPRLQTNLILPHPQMHRRVFVLAPLLKVEPNWWHPTLNRSGKQLLSRLGQRAARELTIDVAASRLVAGAFRGTESHGRA